MAFRKFNVKKFVYISSSMVYGDFVDGTKEDGNTKPKNIYGEAKLTGERMVKLFAKRDGLNYNIIRPSGVYGPGDMPDRVVSKFFAKAMKNETITYTMEITKLTSHIGRMRQLELSKRHCRLWPMSVLILRRVMPQA